MPGSSLTRNNVLNPYLADDVYERLNDLRFKRKARKWNDFFSWAVPHLEKVHAAEERRAKRRAARKGQRKAGSAKAAKAKKASRA